MNLSEAYKDDFIHTIDADDTYAEYTPGDDEDGDDDWDDEEDENFDDLAADENDLHEIIVEENIDDADDDDHLPGEEDF